MSVKILNHEIIGVLQQTLINDLDASIQPNTINDIGLISEALDKKVIKYIGESLLSNSAFYLSESYNKNGDIFNLIINDIKYFQYFESSVKNGSLLQYGIIFKDVKHSQKKTVKKKVNLLYSGKYESIEIIIPELFFQKIDIQFIIELIEALISTSNNWLKNIALKLIGEKYIVSQNLYNYLRNIIPNENITENMWLYASFNNNSFYILDDTIIKKAINLFDKLSKKIGVTPLKILSEILDRKIAYNETGTYITEQLRDTEDFEISNLGYSKNNIIYAHAEILMYGDDLVTVIPIYMGQNEKLSIGIPFDYRDVVEPILAVHQKKLEDEFKLINSRLRKFVRNMNNTKSKLDYGKIGEFSAGFIKNYFGN